MTGMRMSATFVSAARFGEFLFQGDGYLAGPVAFLCALGKLPLQPVAFGRERRDTVLRRP